MFRDLTRQRQLEEELRQAHKMEAIGQLAGGIAHDFNNLLTDLLGNLSMADRELPHDSALRQYLEPARQAARRAAKLTTQLLGFSRRSPLLLQPCSVNPIACALHELLRHRGSAPIEFRLELQTDLWEIAADPAQVHQVLLNLCMNAVEAMSQGGRLTIRTGNTHLTADEAYGCLEARESDFVKIFVKDTGVGLTPEAKRHSFEPFYTTKGPGKGTGLGLAMSYGIIKQHEGWITCSSEVDQGTVFTIFLPRSARSTSELKSQTAALPSRGARKESSWLMMSPPSVRSLVSSWGGAWLSDGRSRGRHFGSAVYRTTSA